MQKKKLLKFNNVLGAFDINCARVFGGWYFIIFEDGTYGPCLDTSGAGIIRGIYNSHLRFVYEITEDQRIFHKIAETKWLSLVISSNP